MDPVSLVVGALIDLGGVLVGRLLPNRRSSVPPAQASLTQGPRTPQPICGCGHHLVFHDQKDKTCQAQVVIPGRWTGERTHTYRKCMCQGYRGPMPVDEYYVPDIIDGE